jgi:HD-GYP domain-containing protein (c-di-GMP phosphodiesterase class II)
MNLPVSHLVPGMKLSRPVYGQKGQMLLNVGVKLTPTYIRGLTEHRVLAVAVETIHDVNVKETEMVLEESIRAEAMVNLQNWVETNRKQEEFTGVVETVNVIIDEILAGKKPIGGLAEISATDVYTFAHSIDVCASSVYIGIYRGYKKDDLLKLGIGSILHDLGKAKVAPQILNKPAELTKKEFEQIMMHPTWGYEMLVGDLANQIDPRSLEIVLSHHERYDGSGYPRGLKHSEISDMSYICALADVYQAMTTERVYRPAFPPNEAYEMILAYGDHKIKHDLVKLFAKCIYAYPMGSLVLLSSGEIGCVTDTNRNLPFRPIVTMLETREEVDLSKELAVVIQRALTPDEVQASYLKYSGAHA